MLFLSLHVIFKGSQLDLFGRPTLIIKITSGTKVLENKTLIKDQMGKLVITLNLKEPKYNLPLLLFTSSLYIFFQPKVPENHLCLN